MKKINEGMTLIEVLIALVIISVALTAIIKATSQTVRANTYLKQKTVALWVAEYAMSEVQLKIVNLDSGVNEVNEVMSMLNQMWYWQGTRIKTPNATIIKYRINVYDHDPDTDSSPLITLESYASHDEK